MSPQSTILVAGERRLAPPGLRVIEAAPFAGRARAAGSVHQIVVHESVTRTAAGTERVLRRRGLGVHLMVAPDGLVYQHGDLATLRLAHAAEQNGPSVGLEVVNPYYPGTKDGAGAGTWPRVLAAKWAHRGRYTVPPLVQAEAVAQLIDWITTWSCLDVPQTWRGLVDGRIRMGRIVDTNPRAPGIWAHHYTAHADGAWPVLYAWLRLDGRLAPAAAYERACDLAEACRTGWIDPDAR